ncbi:hypothetical protein [Pseudomonas anguilliseptica]|uniref:Uncharacterized protein n=1 Tax=Pseudomonas anguilliseptica TaxID=53406 RepID=A0A1H4P6Z5_PSEAG|nr:hypothetical protein [Pseudomonas anguilliseptica]SEC03008.1 hypothetical protein SAMN05421553_0201 [Pseudomonas anguilliseptica]
MKKSILDPHTNALLQRARMGYSQRMLQLFLLRERSINVSQPTLSRWFAKHPAVEVDLPPDAGFQRYREHLELEQSLREHTRLLARWRGHIERKRSQGESLGSIQSDLLSRGVKTSKRSIRRELGAE